jgi:hypothetical protein
LFEDLVAHPLELIDQDAELIGDCLFGSDEVVGDAPLHGGDENSVTEKSGVKLEDLGWLGAEFAAGAFAQFIDLGACGGECGMEASVLRLDLGLFDCAVWNDLFGRTA